MGETNQDFIDKDGFHHTEVAEDGEDGCPKCHSDNVDPSTSLPDVWVCKDCGLTFDIKTVAVWKEPQARPLGTACAEGHAHPVAPCPGFTLSEVEEDAKI